MNEPKILELEATNTIDSASVFGNTPPQEQEE